MQNERGWRLALAEFEAIRKNIPPSVSESFVADYHSVLDRMASSSGEGFDEFRIPASEITPRIISAQRAGRYSPARKYYTKDSFCESNYFRRKIDALAAYLLDFEDRARRAQRVIDSKDYWSMSTTDLETLANKFGIEGYGDQHGHIDRGIIISALLDRDKRMESGTQEDGQRKSRYPPLDSDLAHRPASDASDHRQIEGDGSQKAAPDVVEKGGFVATPTEILEKAIKKVPQVKYALAVAGVVSAVAIIAGFKIDWRIAIFGTVVMFIFMAIFVIFATVARLKPAAIALPATVFLWFSLVLFACCASSLFTWMVADWPNGLASILDPALRPNASPGTGLLIANPLFPSGIKTDYVATLDSPPELKLLNVIPVAVEVRSGGVRGNTGVWEVKRHGEFAGTDRLWIESLSLKVDPPIVGLGIKYRAQFLHIWGHINVDSYEPAGADGARIGKVDGGEYFALQSIRIGLTGKASRYYDVFYRIRYLKDNGSEIDSPEVKNDDTAAATGNPYLSSLNDVGNYPPISYVCQLSVRIAPKAAKR